MSIFTYLFVLVQSCPRSIGYDDSLIAFWWRIPQLRPSFDLFGTYSSRPASSTACTSRQWSIHYKTFASRLPPRSSLSQCLVKLGDHQWGYWIFCSRYQNKTQGTGTRWSKVATNFLPGRIVPSHSLRELGCLQARTYAALMGDRNIFPTEVVTVSTSNSKRIAFIPCRISPDYVASVNCETDCRLQLGAVHQKCVSIKYPIFFNFNTFSKFCDLKRYFG